MQKFNYLDSIKIQRNVVWATHYLVNEIEKSVIKSLISLAKNVVGNIAQVKEDKNNEIKINKRSNSNFLNKI